MNYLLSFRERNRGGAVVPGHLEVGTGLGTLDQLRAEPSLTFLLHGYNVDYDKGKERLLPFATMLPSAAGGGIVSTLWPGDHWLGFLSYSFEGRDADDSAAELAKFINDHILSTVPIAFVAHSLGNRVAMETAMLLSEHETPELCLMAAAIDDYSLASSGDYLTATNNAGRVAVLWSKKDTILKYAYPAGDLLQAFIFWDDSVGFALGYGGPKPYYGTPVPSNVMDIQVEANHNEYLPENDPPTPKQRSAANFANAVVGHDPSPNYP